MALDLADKKFVYFIQETIRDEDGGFIPCVAIEGEDGYYPTDWNWGTNREEAEACANQKNERMGIDSEEAHKIVLGTMFKKVTS